jgi:hypothetical protein
MGGGNPFSCSSASPPPRIAPNLSGVRGGVAVGAPALAPLRLLDRGGLVGVAEHDALGLGVVDDEEVGPVRAANDERWGWLTG